MAARSRSDPNSRPTATPRHRDSVGPAWLSEGYRPFFLLAGLWALIALPISVAMILGKVPIATAYSPIQWHFHELMFGYLAAAIAGFVLTAVPNWTGRLPLQGFPLLALLGVWCAGRLAIALSGLIGLTAAAVLDALFVAALLVLVSREIIAGRNWRNLPLPALFVLLLGSNLLFHAVAADLLPAEGMDRRSAIATVALLIALIGGRVTPSFTRNWLAKRQSLSLPAAFGPFDRATLLATLLALAVWVVAPEGLPCAITAALSAALNLLRLLRWQGYRVAQEPLLWVLHLGCLWVAIALGLVSASATGLGLAEAAAVHAFTTGAMGTMTLGVMSRAILGHGGHELHAGPMLSTAFVLMTVAGVSRVAAAFATDLYHPLIQVAAAAWTAAFFLFLWACAPKVLSRRTGR